MWIRMTEEESKKFEEMIDEKWDKIRNMTAEEIVEKAKKHMENMKPLYKWRKWNGKKRMRELVYKPYPPKDDYYKWQ